MKVIRLGSGKNNDVVIDDPSVSENHLQITINSKNEILLIDLGSENGTFVNGARVSKTQLESSDILKAGNVILPWPDYLKMEKSHSTPEIENDITDDYNPGSNYRSSGMLDEPEKQLPSGLFYSKLTQKWLHSIAILFLIFVFLPIKIGDNFIFINFHAFSSGQFGGAPGAIKFILIAPLIFAFLLFYFKKQKRNHGINLLVILMGLIPTLIFFTDNSLKFATRYMGDSDQSFKMLLGLIAFVGILGGSYGLMQNNNSKNAKLAAAVGGVAALISLLLPTESINGGTNLGFIQAIEMLSMDDRSGILAVSGLAILISLGLITAAAILSLRYFNQDIEHSPELAKKIYRLYLWAFSPYLLIVLVSLYSAGAPNSGAVFLIMIKMLSLVIGMFMLIPIGFGELMNPVEPTEQTVQEEKGDL